MSDAVYRKIEREMFYGGLTYCGHPLPCAAGVAAIEAYREEKLIERSPLFHVPRVKTPVLILHAERDVRCPIEQAEQFFVALRLHGVETEFVRFPEDNHDLTRGGKPRNRVEHCRRIADWFDAHR